MTLKENILQELTELKSALAGYTRQNVYTTPAGYFEGLAEQVLSRIKALDAAENTESNGQVSFILNNYTKQTPYTVPSGYFEGLAAQVLNRIKAMEAKTAGEELTFLSPSLSTLPKEMPYSVPVGYFEGLGERTLQHISTKVTVLSAKDELETISPFLSGLKKEMPYNVPAGYFESLVTDVTKEASKPAAKVISMASRKWFRYAAAAVVVGVIVTVGFIRFGNTPLEGKSLATIEKKINKEIKKMSDKELDDFLQYTDAGLDGTENVKSATPDESKELLNDVTVSELQEFLNETADVDNDSEISMMN